MINTQTVMLGPIGWHCFHLVKISKCLEGGSFNRMISVSSFTTSPVHCNGGSNMRFFYEHTLTSKVPKKILKVVDVNVELILFDFNVPLLCISQLTFCCHLIS